jgi:hypothetical protein
MNRVSGADDGNDKARYKVVSAHIFDDTTDLGGESVDQTLRALRTIVLPLAGPASISFTIESRRQFGEFSFTRNDDG